MAYYYRDDKLILHLHLQTGSKQNSIGGLYGERLRVRIKAQPIEGKANKQLIAFLASEFGVSKSKVAILSGLRSRDKTVSIVYHDKQPAWFAKLSQGKTHQ
jgi:uncharacterized protein